jgi:hypothetical protein
MKKDKLIRMRDFHASLCGKVVTHRYANPKRPEVCVLWVVNDTHEFKTNRECHKFVEELLKN